MYDGRMLTAEHPPGKLPSRVERRLNRLERDPSIRTLAQLRALVAASTGEPSQRPLGAPAICSSRAARIRLLALRVRLGLAMFHPDDITFLRGALRAGRRTAP